MAEGGHKERDGVVVQSLVWWAVMHRRCHLACVNLSKILADRSAKGCRHMTALCGPCKAPQNHAQLSSHFLSVSAPPGSVLQTACRFW